MQAVTLAVTELRIHHPPILALNDALVTVGAVPESITVASAYRVIGHTVNAVNHTLIAELTPITSLAMASAVVAVKCAMLARLFPVAVNEKLACVALGPHPRQDTLFTNAGFNIQVTTVAAILRTFLCTIVSIVGRDTVVTNALCLVKQTASFTILVTNIAASPREEPVTFANALTRVHRAMHTVYVALVTSLPTPVPVANA